MQVVLRGPRIGSWSAGFGVRLAVCISPGNYKRYSGREVHVIAATHLDHTSPPIFNHDHHAQVPHALPRWNRDSSGTIQTATPCAH